MPDKRDTYKTIEAPVQGIYKEKGSKFLAFAYPVSHLEEIKIHLDEIKKKYFDARHHCYAYALGFEQEIYRMNDDGEPSGTAGKPIYGQILSHELTQILIIVVRYFGGTLLGTSGLIRSYKLSAENAISNALIIEKPILKTYRIYFTYAQMNAVMKIMKDNSLTQKEHHFDLNCHLIFQVINSKEFAICEALEKEEVRLEYLGEE